jgi:uncharacterized protein
MSDPTTLSVRGAAALEVTADHAVLSLQVVRQDADRELAVAAAGGAAAAVRAAVAAAAGVRRSAISGVRVTEVSEWDELTRASVRVGWQAVLGGTVHVVATQAAALVGDVVGAGAEVVDVAWRVDDDNPAHREVRRLAVADARRAADDFAAALGGTTGSLLGLADPGLLASGDFVSLSRGSRAFALSAPEQLEVDPQVITLRAVVEARYLLEDA